jgi:hypothetical protein
LPTRAVCFNFVGMWGERSGAPIALAIIAALTMSGCSVIETAAPPPSQPAYAAWPATPAPAPPQRSAPPGAGAARAEIASWLSGAGYRDFQVAALIQLADVESGFRPCVVGPGGYHYLYQWTGTRLRQLREFAQTSGCPHIRTQLAFTDRELRYDPKFTCFWGATTTPAAYVALRRVFGRGSC